MFTKEDKKFFRGKKWNKKQRKILEKQENPPLKLNHIEEFGIMTRDLFRLQRICNLERSTAILILDFEAKRKKLGEEIERLMKGGNECS